MNTEPNPASSGGDDEGRSLPYPELTDRDFLDDALGALRDHTDTGGYVEGVFSERDESAAYLLYLAHNRGPKVYAKLDSEIVKTLEGTRLQSGASGEGEQKSGELTLAEKAICAIEAMQQLQTELQDSLSKAGIAVRLGLLSLRMSDAVPWLFDYDREAEPVRPLAQRIHDLRSDLRILRSKNANDLKYLHRLISTEGSFATAEGMLVATLLYDARSEAAGRGYSSPASRSSN